MVTALDEGMIEREDEAHLAHAAEQGRVLYSFNVGHFHRLHTEWVQLARSHAGIILGRQQQYSIGGQMRRVLKLIATRSAEEMQNRVEFLSAWD